MRTIQDESALREAFAVEPGGPAPEGCPPPGRLYDAVRGELPANEIRDLVDHLAGCPHCAEAWRLAAAFEEEGASGGEEGSASPKGRDPRPLRPAGWAAAAAVLVAIVAAGIWWSTGPRSQEPPAFRAGGGEEIRSLVPEDEPLPRDEAVLRWTPVPEDAPEETTYDLLVSTEDLEPVAEVTELREPRHRISPERLEGLPSGSELLWRVEARLPDGRRVASPTFFVRIE